MYVCFGIHVHVLALLLCSTPPPLPGCVLINTTDTLVAVSYSVQQEGAWPPPCEGCGLEIGPHCTFFRQVFVQDGTREVKFNDEGLCKKLLYTE